MKRNLAAGVLVAVGLLPAAVAKPRTPHASGGPPPSSLAASPLLQRTERRSSRVVSPPLSRAVELPASEFPSALSFSSRALSKAQYSSSSSPFARPSSLVRSRTSPQNVALPESHYHTLAHSRALTPVARENNGNSAFYQRENLSVYYNKDNKDTARTRVRRPAVREQI